MNEEAIWKERVKFLWNAELIFDEIKNKLGRKQKRKIEEKLRKMTYRLWVTSPKIKNNPKLKEAVIQECLADWKFLNRMRKRVRTL